MLILLFIFLYSLAGKISIPDPKNLHIVHITVCYYGDLNPHLAIASELIKRGHRVSLICLHTVPLSLKKKVDIMGIKLIAEFPFEESNAKSQDAVTILERTLVETIYPTFERAHRALQSLTESKNRPDVVVCMEMIIPIADLARKLQIPAVSVQTTPPLPESSWAPTPYYGLELPKTLFSKLWMYKNTRYMLTHFSVIISSEISAIRSKLGYSESADSVHDYWKGFPKLFGMFAGFNLNPTHTADYIYIGSFIPNDPEPLSPELKNWLDQHRRVIFVTFGITGRPHQNQVENLLTGLLQIEGISILLTVNETLLANMKAGSDPSRIKIITWAPQIAVLNHSSVEAVITHCGFGGMSESLYFEKPFLTLPFLYDQLDNARNAIRAGVALPLSEDFTPEDLSRKMAQILTNASFHRRAKLISRWLKQAGGVQQAANVIENTYLDFEAIKVWEDEIGLSILEKFALVGGLSFIAIVFLLLAWRCWCAFIRRKFKMH